MARLTIFLLLAALLVAARASSRQSQQEENASCKWGELKKVNLKPCHDYMELVMERMSKEFEGRKEMGEEEEEGEDRSVLRMRGIRGRSSGNPEQEWSVEEQIRQWCCNQLRNLKDKPECMCQAQQQVMEQQKTELKDQQMVPLLEGQVWYLPLSCGLRSQHGCDIAGTSQ